MKNVAKGFAYVGKFALQVALWFSAHPEVVKIIINALPKGV